MGRIEDLAVQYSSHICAPWPRNLAAEQRVIFVVYPKVDERKLRARIELFEMATIQAGHKWQRSDLTGAFARWMAGTDYREVYFEEPDALAMKLRSDSLQFVVGEMRAVLTASGVDEETVVAAQGVASLYGFTRVSLVLGVPYSVVANLPYNIAAPVLRMFLESDSGAGADGGDGAAGGGAVHLRSAAENDACWAWRCRCTGRRAW